MWTHQVSSEAIDVLLLSQHNPAVCWLVIDIQNWNLDNEVKSGSGKNKIKKKKYGYGF